MSAYSTPHKDPRAMCEGHAIQDPGGLPDNFLQIPEALVEANMLASQIVFCCFAYVKGHFVTLLPPSSHE
jgi:hypothetical protein